MPQQSGEVLQCTLFADVHYYFSSPDADPLHHRFAKRSYLYLYTDASQTRARLEIANHAGTPRQDAFNGYLDHGKISYSYSQPTVITVSGAQAPAQPVDSAQWHLPAYSLDGGGKYMYKVQSIDAYLWTVDDTSLLLDLLRQAVPATQLDIKGVPTHKQEEHRDPMLSPVVQRLENVALSNASTSGRSDSVGSHSVPQARENGNYQDYTGASSPLPSHQSSVGVNHQMAASPPPQAFTPIAAYNPAAPAAPEARMHREKTPPPPDAEGGTGLSGNRGHGIGNQPQQMSFGPTAGGISFSGPPVSIPGPPSFAPPPTSDNDHAPYGGHQSQQSQYQQYHPQTPQPDFHRQSSFPSSINQSFAPQPTQAIATPPSFAPPPTAAQSPTSFAPPPTHAHHHDHHHSTQPSSSPGIHYPGDPTPHHQYQQQQQHAYGSHPPSSVNHSIHSQVYQPEPYSSGKPAKPAQAGPGQDGATGRLENRMQGLEVKAKGLEKKFNSFLKRLDK